VERIVSRGLLLLALLALAGHAWYSVPALLDDPRWSSTARVDAVALALRLLSQLACGRLVLAFLPPGSPGSHALARLPATAATSLLLGDVALELEARFLPAPETWAARALFLAPWLVLLVLRLVTLPGALVPRHAPPEERRGKLARLVVVLPCLWCLAALARAPEDTVLWDWLAFLILLDHGLQAARRSPLGRTLLVFGAALTAQPFLSADAAVEAAARFGTGALFLVPWIRRADRRAGVLALIAFGSLGPTEPRLALAGLLGVLLAARAPQRRFALVGGLVAALVLVLPDAALLRGGPPSEWSARDVFESGYSTQEWGVAWIYLTLTCIAGAGILVGRGARVLERRPWRASAIEEPLREVGVLAALLGLGFLALRTGGSYVAQPFNTLLVLFPIALALAGLVLVPAERPADIPGA